MGFELLLQGENSWRLLVGLAVTVKIAMVSVFFSGIVGVIWGTLVSTNQRFIRIVHFVYLEIVRIVPLLVLLFIAYFGLAKWFDLHITGERICIVVFTFWGIAEMGDLVRGALSSIDKQQRESAYALGLTTTQTFMYVLIPQSIKRIIPSAVNLFTRMIKTSSLAMLIGVLEVIKVGQQIIETSLFTQPNAALWIYGLIFLLYFIICYPLSRLAAYLEQRWSY